MVDNGRVLLAIKGKTVLLQNWGFCNGCITKCCLNNPPNLSNNDLFQKTNHKLCAFCNVLNNMGFLLKENTLQIQMHRNQICLVTISFLDPPLCNSTKKHGCAPGEFLRGKSRLINTSCFYIFEGRLDCYCSQWLAKKQSPLLI